MSKLNQVPALLTKSKKRLGRGHGSGKGSHTVGRGTKGAGARVGATIPLWFEGGQLPLVKRLPMIRGKGRFKVVRPVAEVTVGQLQNLDAKVITIDTLKVANLVPIRIARAKVIAGGSISKAVTIQGLRVSAGALKAIEAAGGKVVH